MIRAELRAAGKPWAVMNLYPEPLQIRAGDTIQWSRCVPAFPASGGWTLSYSYTSTAGNFKVTCTADGDDYVATLAAAASSALAASTYTWVAYVMNGAGERHTIASGNLSVLPDIAALEAGSDQRSDAQRALDNITTFLAGTATQGVAEYEIHGRSIKYHTIADLMSLRTMFQGIVNQERAAAGQQSQPRRVLTGFGGCF